DICYDISVEEDILGQITFSEVMDAIKKIPAGYREVLNLYGIDGYTHREISKMLGISEGNSKQRVRRARNMLKEIISEKSNSESSKLNETAA
ncbi:MAG: RNA polymerase sigma-70 factor (ECF subfamily), partial [Flammeovirgaceae bacterium]